MINNNDNENILILENSKTISNTLIDSLEYKDYNIVNTNNTTHILNMIEDNYSVLLILDMEFSNIEIIKLLEQLKKLDLLYDFPILAVFKELNISYLKKLIKKGVTDFFNKPSLDEEFLLKIDLLLKISQEKKATIQQNDKILNHQSKMSTIGEMIGNIAHQWRQPLTAISVAASGIKVNYEFNMEDRDETIKELENIVQNTKFLSSTINDFQNFLKLDRVTQNFNIKETIEKTLDIIKANLTAYNIEVIKKYYLDISIHGIQNDLIQVLLNLINNAFDILKDIDGKRYILVQTNLLEDNNCIITIQDSAGGVPSDIINKIFDPYFTTKHQNSGTGLGLYMTHRIITKMGGEITIKNEPFIVDNQNYFGAKFTINIPINR